MSPDDIFAGQMWPWPEPALKRDAMGRVLFVNAAFLQMYGGQIEDWRGNIVTGWPAPQPPDLPYRFETRLPSAEGEQVYDWMEFTMADGNAFAMARNVTYLFQPTDPNPGTEAEPPVQAESADQAEASQMATASLPPAAQPAFAQTQTAEPVQQDAPVEVPALQVSPQEPSVAVPVVESSPEPEAVLSPPSDVSVEAPVAAPVAEAATDPAFDSATYSDIVEPVSATPKRPERRMLPIENEDAVLGNNWRDAVIAKAVGAEVTEAAPALEEPAAAAPATESTGGPIRILLAEDNAINALLTRTLLEAEGHVVDTVEDGSLAVEAMKTATYDLIFMDMRMPNMDGLEATRKIRAMDNVSKGLPIIALTANAFDDDRNACFDSGMNDFMTKPVSAEELSEMVRTWTKNKAERDAA